MPLAVTTVHSEIQYTNSTDGLLVLYFASFQFSILFSSTKMCYHARNTVEDTGCNSVFFILIIVVLVCHIYSCTFIILVI